MKKRLVCARGVSTLHFHLDSWTGATLSTKALGAVAVANPVSGDELGTNPISVQVHPSMKGGRCLRGSNLCHAKLFDQKALARKVQEKEGRMSTTGKRTLLVAKHLTNVGKN